MKSSLAVFALLAFLVVPGVSSASADGPSTQSDPPLRVKVASPDGKPKLKVARALKVLVGCSTPCRLSVRIILKMPANTVRVGAKRDLDADDIWTTGIKLTNFGLRYLKSNYRRSTMKVVVSGRKLGTSTRVRKVRTFGFYR